MIKGDLENVPDMMHEQPDEVWTSVEDESLQN